jgi:hypothetical protein
MQQRAERTPRDVVHSCASLLVRATSPRVRRLAGILREVGYSHACQPSMADRAANDPASLAERRTGADGAKGLNASVLISVTGRMSGAACIPSNTSSVSIALIEMSIKRGYLQFGHKQSAVATSKSR